jgi:hypothetical protein
VYMVLAPCGRNMDWVVFQPTRYENDVFARLYVSNVRSFCIGVFIIVTQLPE